MPRAFQGHKCIASVVGNRYLVTHIPSRTSEWISANEFELLADCVHYTDPVAALDEAAIELLAESGSLVYCEASEEWLAADVAEEYRRECDDAYKQDSGLNAWHMGRVL